LGGYALKHGRRVPAGWRRVVAALGLPLRGGLRPAMLRLVAGAAALGAVPNWLAAQAAPAAQLPWYWGGYAVAVLALLLASQRVAGNFGRQLVNAEEAARQIAAGNLVNEVANDARGELRNLYFYLDIMRKSLIGISSEVIGKTSDHVRTIAKLHTDSQGLADRTEAQAGSLQDTAASVEQLAATVARNAESARTAAALTQESRTIVGQGGEIVSQLVTTMHGIDESSRKIADIVSVIEGIAFQTNILALNAAVEAARAGDQGKGFAVVAGEVRSLAQRTTQAAKEVKGLIEESVGRMSAGSQQASQAGDTMQDILQSVERVTTLMEEISTASQEQAQGVDRISSAVNEMDGVVQQNVSLVGELSHVAEHLGEESAALAQAIGVFRTPASRQAPDAVALRTQARTARLAPGAGNRLALASPARD
ncbi:MAG: methyl-accepting chemotaxis protein, partial [Bordetella sp.]|nr:methyl-accepting chemotaxis protein [Bordetella sp.]